MPSQTSTAIRDIRAASPTADLEGLRRSYLDVLKLGLCDLAGAGTRTVTWTGERRLFSRELEPNQIAWREGGRDWPLNAFTMVGLRRLADLQACVEAVVADGVEGDLIEAGAWRGGASILIRATLDTLGAHDRTVWVADSFRGFPEPQPDDAKADRKLNRELGAYDDYLASPLEEVRKHFERFGCERGVRFVPGFFEQTMPRLRGRKWALIRLDADTYKGTWVPLEALYPGLSAGGYLIVDDYHWPYLPTSRGAVDDYRRENGIDEPIQRIDASGARWRRAHEQTATARMAPAAREAQPQDAPGAQHWPRPRAAIPTDRELQLTAEVEELQARVEQLESELEALRASGLTDALGRKIGKVRKQV